MIVMGKLEKLPPALEVAREFFRLAKNEGDGTFTAFKLQKLLYYAQAHALHERGRELFAEKVKAWENGPVVPDIFHRTRGYRFIPDSHEELGTPSKLSEADRELVHSVWERYKHLTGDELSELTHAGSPWRIARLKRRRSAEVDPADMRDQVARDHEEQAKRFQAFLSGLDVER